MCFTSLSLDFSSDFWSVSEILIYTWKNYHQYCQIGDSQIYTVITQIRPSRSSKVVNARNKYRNETKTRSKRRMKPTVSGTDDQEYCHVSQSLPTSEATLNLHSITAPVRHIIYTTTQFHENTIACITFFLTNLKRLICCRYTQNLVTPLVNNWNLQFKTCRGSWSEHKSKTPKMCFTIALIDKTIGLLFVNKDTSMNKVKWNMKMKYTIYNYWAYN